MKNFLRKSSLLFITLFMIGPLAFSQLFCCDPDAPGGVTGSGGQCGQEDGGFFPFDGAVCDSDCTGYNPDAPECATIPIDGGLSLLALAGGGLATAAMRRRREEEAAQETV